MVRAHTSLQHLRSSPVPVENPAEAAGAVAEEEDPHTAACSPEVDAASVAAETLHTGVVPLGSPAPVEWLQHFRLTLAGPCSGSDMAPIVKLACWMFAGCSAPSAGQSAVCRTAAW